MESIENNIGEKMSNKFKTQPYKHQLERLNKYGRRPFFAILDEMGTGKTWVVINTIADLWSSNDCDAVLIFAPNGVHTNWTRLEFPKHMPDWVNYKAVGWQSNHTKKFKAELENLYAPSKDRELRILTMNWEGLQHKKSFDEAMKFAQLSRRLMIVCDESDAFKNPSTTRCKNLMKLKKFSHWRRIMSGTPINNSPFDAFSQFSFLDENILQTTSFYAFKTEYAEMMPTESRLIQKIAKNKTPWRAADIKELHSLSEDVFTIICKSKNGELITRANNITLSIENGDYDDIPELTEKLRLMFDPSVQNAAKTEVLKKLLRLDGIVMDHQRDVHRTSSSKRMPQIVDSDKKTGKKKYKNLDRLSKLIAPHSCRVLKSECVDLPEKIYKTLFFEMTEEQRVIYNKAKEECRLEFEGQNTPFSKLTAITKLAQITSGYYIHPLAEEPVRIEGGNPKLELLRNRVEAIVNSGEKVIVWARYTTQIEDIVKALKADGHEVVQYYGAIKKGERVKAIDDFENGSANVFVGNQQAGGTGITLVAASYVIYFSNNFSLRDRLQSEDRAHRIGQTKNVTYINIIANNTIDEAIVSCLMNKQDVAKAIVDDGLKLFFNNEK